MPTIELIKKLPKSTHYNSRWIADRYDIDVDKFTKEWRFSFQFPKEWSIGLIVGNSGSGKSLIARNIFDKVYQGQIIENDHVPIVESYGKADIQDIVNSLTSVGMGSIPEWLTPYGCLSTGQRMRADLAACLLNDEKTIVYDEFTSVVDRQVAKVISHSIAKAFRKTQKQFVAVTCHHDVEDWLEPDWILDMDLKEFRNSKKKDLKSRFKSNLVRDLLGSFSKTITI